MLKYTKYTKNIKYDIKYGIKHGTKYGTKYGIKYGIKHDIRHDTKHDIKYDTDETSQAHTVQNGLQRRDVQPHFSTELVVCVRKEISIATRSYKAIKLLGKSGEQSLFDRVNPGVRHIKQCEGQLPGSTTRYIDGK